MAARFRRNQGTRRLERAGRRAGRSHAESILAEQAARAAAESVLAGEQAARAAAEARAVELEAELRRLRGDPA